MPDIPLHEQLAEAKRELRERQSRYVRLWLMGWLHEAEWRARNDALQGIIGTLERLMGQERAIPYAPDDVLSA